MCLAVELVDAPPAPHGPEMGGDATSPRHSGRSSSSPMRAKRSLQAGAERLPRCALLLDRIAQDLAHLLLGAPPVPPCAPLQARLHIILQLADQELSHRGPLLRSHRIGHSPAHEEYDPGMHRHGCSWSRIITADAVKAGASCGFSQKCYYHFGVFQPSRDRGPRMIGRSDTHRREQRQLQWIVARPVAAMTVILIFGLIAIGWEIREVSRRVLAEVWSTQSFERDNSSILECLTHLEGRLNKVDDRLGRVEHQVADLAYEIRRLAAHVDGEVYVGLLPMGGVGVSNNLPVSVISGGNIPLHPCS